MHQLLIDLFQQAAAGLAEMQKMLGLLVRAKGGGVLPLLDHDETVGLLLMAVQVVLQTAGFNRFGLAGAGGDSGDQGEWARHGWAPVQDVAMLGYSIDEKNCLLLESLSIFF